MRNHAAPIVVLGGLATGLALAPCATAPAQAAAHNGITQEPDAAILRQIESFQELTWRWQRVMSAALTPTSDSARHDPSLAYKRWVRNLWRGRAVQAQRTALHPPHLAAWICIHRYEAAWNEGGAPYYGGLQMDVSFQLMYARALFRRKGTADHWTPLEQMWAAENALRAGRGFWPWPSSARLCGLL